MKRRLREILLAKSVILGKEFRLSSGKTSNFYVDARITTLDPEGAFLIGNLFLEMIKEFEVDSVGGYSIGADPIVSSISLLSHISGNPIPAFIIRKTEKSHGTGKQIEGNFKTGDSVVLFDDVVTSGGSILRGADVVRNAGGNILSIMSVIDREEGGRELIEAAGYKFYSIFLKKDLI